MGKRYNNNAQPRGFFKDRQRHRHNLYGHVAKKTRAFRAREFKPLSTVSSPTWPITLFTLLTTIAITEARIGKFEVWVAFIQIITNSTTTPINLIATKDFGNLNRTSEHITNLISNFTLIAPEVLATQCQEEVQVYEIHNGDAIPGNDTPTVSGKGLAFSFTGHPSECALNTTITPFFQSILAAYQHSSGHNKTKDILINIALSTALIMITVIPLILAYVYRQKCRQKCSTTAPENPSASRKKSGNQKELEGVIDEKDAEIAEAHEKTEPPNESTRLLASGK